MHKNKQSHQTRGYFFPCILLLIGLSHCTPTKLVISPYNPQLASSDNLGMVYYLPKKYLEVEVTYLIFNHIRIVGFKDKRVPDKFETVAQAAMIEVINIREESLPDPEQAYLLRLEHPRHASNNLNVQMIQNEQGILTSLNTTNEGKAAEFLSGITEIGTGLVSLGNNLTGALSGLGDRGEGEDKPDKVEYAIDTLRQTFTKLLEISSPDTTYRLRGRDFMPEISHTPEIRITLKGTGFFKNTSDTNPWGTNKSLSGVLYRQGVPIQTIIEIRGEDHEMFRDKRPQRIIVYDRPIVYPQFGAFSLAQIPIQGNGKQTTNIEFYASGGIKAYTLDKQSRNEEKLNQWKKALENTQNAALDATLGNQEAFRNKKAEVQQSQLDALEAEIAAEEKKLELEQRKKDLKKKQEEMKKKDE